MLPIHVFPKYAAQLSVEGLADWCLQVGANGVDALIRTGYWVQEENLAVTLAPFCTRMRSAGLEVITASVSYTPGDLLHDDTPLRILADQGISLVRLGYVKAGSSPNLRSDLDNLRLQLSALAQVCERCQIRGVVQMHGGTIHQSASGLWWLLRDISPNALGVMADPGNMRAQEGHERWDYIVGLLHEYIAMVGVKDVAWSKNAARGNEPGKGWRPDWVPLSEGMINWQDIVGQLCTQGLDVPLQLAPFYATKDFALHTQLLQDEITYLKGVIAQVNPQQAVS